MKSDRICAGLWREDLLLFLLRSFESVRKILRNDEICWQQRRDLLAETTRSVGSNDEICWQQRRDLLAEATRSIGRNDEICWQQRRDLLAETTRSVLFDQICLTRRSRHRLPIDFVTGQTSFCTVNSADNSTVDTAANSAVNSALTT
ncbi:hypothetical protein F511_19455 [Dorcoceras hygrometricum]|uniref:Uncharacterized protein n=1 Tax=Dorcoceras hygrometricum TaxID=472368 RepID=A0A2Z7A655_9LAMI|nr:hypothetical protein F511_19455 [Dorcoceras hygrometricum]